MADIWKYLRNLFQSVEESSPSQPAIHELIQRSEEEKTDYERWKNMLVCRRLTDWLSDQYAIYRVLPDDVDEALDFLNTPSSKGFVIHFYKTRYSLRDIVHLLDYLKEQVLTLNYKAQISDLRIFNRENWVETVQRHYLKPRPNVERQEKMNQQYGNITIELTLRNDQPYNLKLQATGYSDRLYQETEDFKDLMQHLLV